MSFSTKKYDCSNLIDRTLIIHGTPSVASVALPNSSDKKIRRRQNSQQLGTLTNLETDAIAILLLCFSGNAYALKFSRR